MGSLTFGDCEECEKYMYLEEDRKCLSCLENDEADKDDE